MSNSDDPLYRIFEEHLHSGLYDDQTEEVFLRDIVDFYLHELKGYGFIPLKIHEHLQSDLLGEVTEMLRAKTYGHFGIGAYNKARSKKSS